MRVLFCSLLMATILVVSAVAAEKAASCENCGMNFDISPTRVEVTVDMKVGPKVKSYTHIYECLNCSYNALTAKYGDDLNITAVQMLDYQTFGTKNEVMIDGMKAVYLFGVKRMRSTMPPYVISFSSEEKAKSAQKVLGGELVGSFDSVWARLTKHNSEDGAKASGGGGCGENCACGK